MRGRTSTSCPSNETLAAAELYLAGQRQRDRVLAAAAGRRARARYDFVDRRLLAEPVADEPERAGVRRRRAVPGRVRLPVAGRRAAGAAHDQERQPPLHHPVQLWGVLPTFYDARARICREALDTLREHFGERCLDPIRLAIKVKEAPAQGKTIFEYAPWSGARGRLPPVVARLLGHADASVNDDPRRAAAAREVTA